MTTINTFQSFKDVYYDEGDMPFEDKIISICAKEFSVAKSMVLSRNRSEKVKFCRWIILSIFLSKGYTLKDAGGVFGYDHSSVINAMKKLPDDIEKIEYLKNIYTSIQIKIEELN